ncbi:hypothetical protein [Microbacterium sp. CJ77]|jgi:hypothetical protein|uniref:hypothetical protein n=1 Tax=Microbacterium sp. CJ77 TaxID=2079201 RepID=UPI000CD87A2B|nr:hypothetical protein [Microbacterium sp. CJ77]
MKTRILALAAAAVFATFALAGCSSSGDNEVIAPVIMSAEELQGASVELRVGQALDITTGDLAEDSYSAEIADTSIVTFEKGGERDGATFNPGLMAEAVGETEVTLTNEQGGIQPVEFTVTVVAKE